MFRLLRDFTKYESFCVFALFITALIGLVLASDPGPAVAAVEGSVAAPEFPSILIPVLVIIGMAGAVLVILRSKEL